MSRSENILYVGDVDGVGMKGRVVVGRENLCYLPAFPRSGIGVVPEPCGCMDGRGKGGC